MNRIKAGLDIIKKKVNKAPEALPKQDIYEQVRGEGSTDPNKTNDEESPEDDPNSDRNPPSPHQTGTENEDDANTINGSNSSTTPGNTRTDDKDMSVA